MRPLFFSNEIPCSLGQMVRPPGTGLRCHANLVAVSTELRKHVSESADASENGSSVAP